MQAQRVAPVDAGYLSMDAANTTGNVCLLLTLEGTVTRDQLMEQVRRALPGLPMLRRRLHTVAWGLDLPWWVDDTAFDLDRHVVEHDVPEPGGDKAVADLAARLTMIPMDRTRPLWSVHLIHDGSAAQRRSAVLLMMHHTIGDGSAFLATIRGIFGDGAEQSSSGGAAGGWRADPAPFDLEMLWRSAVEAAQWSLSQSMSTATATLGTLGTQIGGVMTTASIPTAPMTPFNKTLSAKRAWGRASVSLEASRPVRRRLGVTVNDILHAMTAAALREWMQRRGGAPAVPLVALVPIGADGPAPDPAAINRIEMSVSELPTHISDPIDRLHAAHESMRRAKAAPMFTETVMDLAARVSSASTSPLTRYAADAAVSMRVMDYMPPGTNLVISNVSMGSDQYSLAGVPVDYVYPLSPLSNGQGIFVTTQGYRGRLNIGLTVCPVLVPDVDDLAASMVTAYDDLCALA
ncbi:MAG: wax ester/triacylglycerol synthase family O-acyltransferase [Dermatophilaceae bacterium]|nr:wax ester/triacylglycerol synthase family O-acyltransferase [Dermatophilaceae bacterium]MBP9917818.1 wax ester/triacylglycerol synthase family O-acyltransferase [Dermatophilaceae bacterium]